MKIPPFTTSCLHLDLLPPSHRSSNHERHQPTEIISSPSKLSLSLSHTLTHFFFAKITMMRSATQMQPHLTSPHQHTMPPTVTLAKRWTTT